MALNIKGLVLALVLGGVSLSVQAEDVDRNYYTISKMKVSEVTRDTFVNPEVIDTIYEKGLDVRQLPGDPVDKAGKVLSIARDLVALGEDIYRLVIKGKPSNKTRYAPISVLPRDGSQAVDILDTENWTMPVKRTFQVVYENMYGADVVTFRYSVMYSYRGSYNGKGAYLTSVQIIPEQVRTLFGFDFTATMKLGGIVNQGTKANPVAGATLLMEYTISSLVVAHNQTETFFVNGRGGFKKY